MAVSMVFTICLTCIAIGSEVAYGIFVSLNVSGLVTSYIICIACMTILLRIPSGENCSQIQASSKNGFVVNHSQLQDFILGEPAMRLI